MKAKTLILVISTITTALIAGLFYAWSCAVIPGLTNTSDANYIAAMQSINIAILNPVFFIGFIGTCLLLPVCTLMHYTRHVTMQFWLVLSATLLYLTGVIGVTALGNIPLNDSLAAFDLKTASAEAIHTQRVQFETSWNALNNIRAYASIAALILMVIACVQQGKTKVIK